MNLVVNVCHTDDTDQTEITFFNFGTSCQTTLVQVVPYHKYTSQSYLQLITLMKFLNYCSRLGSGNEWANNNTEIALLALC